MKTKRIKRIKLDGRSHYHVMSRIAERRFYLGAFEKDMFCDMMWRVAAFSGVRILTYCIMDNHFHLLVEVMEREALTMDKVKKRLPLIYRGDDLERVLCEFKKWEKMGNTQMLNELKQQYERRMFDLSEFMKTLKQRFSIWYNRNHGDRKGTLWEGDRFISALIQYPQRRPGDMGNLAIRTIAAYIELNPVRAGIVEDPKNYQWCGYGAAIAGIASARTAIGLLLVRLDNKRKLWPAVSRAYETYLFGQDCIRGRSQRIEQDVCDKDETLPYADWLLHRIRGFSSGLVVGGKDYINQVIVQKHECFSHKNRSLGACLMRGLDGEGLCTAKM